MNHSKNHLKWKQRNLSERLCKEEHILITLRRRILIQIYTFVKALERAWYRPERIMTRSLHLSNQSQDLRHHARKIRRKLKRRLGTTLKWMLTFRVWAPSKSSSMKCSYHLTWVIQSMASASISLFRRGNSRIGCVSMQPWAASSHIRKKMVKKNLFERRLQR
jgi:hypothetical protein